MNSVFRYSVPVEQRHDDIRPMYRESGDVYRSEEERDFFCLVAGQEREPWI